MQEISVLSVPWLLVLDYGKVCFFYFSLSLSDTLHNTNEESRPRRYRRLKTGAAGLECEKRKAPVNKSLWALLVVFLANMNPPSPIPDVCFYVNGFMCQFGVAQIKNNKRNYSQLDAYTPQKALVSPSRNIDIHIDLIKKYKQKHTVLLYFKSKMFSCNARFREIKIRQWKRPPDLAWRWR